jgi:dihydrofolate synthase/folylpolyglutamate synthase
MNYEELLNWLYSFEKFGIKLGLDRINQICKKLQNPQDKLNIIHVGGTNGKGTVCRLLGSILANSGYKVGIYTSPHLQRFTERFLINYKEISNKDVVKLIEKIRPIIEDMIKKENTPTFFEIVTAIAFQYFYEESVEYAIIEVGLGGRFDATNIVNPDITIITNVSLEHQNILGNKIEDIAFEKAGIIKEGIPLITASSGKALDVIKKISKEKKSRMTVIDNNSWKKISGGVDWQEYLINGSLKDYRIKTSLIGNFQGENIAIALNAIETLQMNGLYVTEDSIYEGIEKTSNPGRMEIVDFEPIILLDGAHNVSGIKYLKNTLENDFIFEKVIIVFGILSDKKIEEILDIIMPIADIIILTKSKNKRAFDPNKLKDMIKNKEVIVKENISDAINYARKISKKQDLICVTGSLFTVGEAKEYLLQ